MQAHEFVTNFEKVKVMLEQIVTDNALQGGATGSGDLNPKTATSHYRINPSANNGAGDASADVVGSQNQAQLAVSGYAGTVQTTQHEQQNSQTSSAHTQ